ncbi:MAG: DUF4838 domain-containing protein [Clostridia bacterium]|nr:DUF4838 domain-containing protein [Clostridia bacterium]
MKKFLCLILALGFIFCSTCRDYNSHIVPDDSEQKDEMEDNTPVIEGHWIVKDGASEYVVLIPDAASSTLRTAAAEFTFFFNRATDINLEIKNNSEYSASEKYISFGETSASDSVAVSETELGAQGFRIKTVGDNIIVKSAGIHGVLWGAYELLTRMFNYEYYAKDVYYIKTDVKELALKNYDITDKPDIEIRAVADSQGYSNPEVAHRLRQFQVYDEFLIPMKKPYHNSFDYVADADGNVDARFLATSGLQLCYTGHGDDSVVEEMLDRSIEYIKPLIEKSEWNDFMYGIEDEYSWCQCDACKDCKKNYGTNSASVILYMNRLRDKLDAYLSEAGIERKINFYWFAYTDIVQPPVHKDANGEYVANDPALICKDGVGILFAPITNNFTQSIYSHTNEMAYEQLKGFKAITNRLLVWTYACNFTDFFVPYDSTTYMQELFKAVVENNGVYLFNQGRHSQGNSSGFDVLRQYLVAKLGWNVNADVEKLTDNFFDVYFGRAKEPMRKMYDELRTIMRYNYDVLGMSGRVLADVENEKYWPVQVLNHWIQLIDEAYALAGDDSALHERILRESIFVRYYQLKFYIIDGDDLEDIRKQFIKDALAVGIVRASEARAINNVFD